MTDWLQRFIPKIEHSARVHGRVLQSVKRLIPTSEYREPERRILLEIARRPDSTDAELALELVMYKSMISREIRGLIQRGFVEEQATPRHKRQRLLRLSTEGKRVAVQLALQTEEAYRAAFEELSAGERAIVLASAEKQIHSPEPSISQSKIAISLSTPGVQDLGSIVARMTEIGHSSYGWNEAFAAEMGLMLHSHIHGLHSGYEAASVAVCRTKRVGACLLNLGIDPFAPDPDKDSVDSWVSALFVTENYRGRGIGDRLMERCIAQAQNISCDTLSMRVSNRQVALIKLLKKHGFKPGARTREDSRYGIREVWRDHTRRLRRINAADRTKIPSD